MKEEVDEATSEEKDKTETSAESKDTAALKGTPALSHIKLWKSILNAQDVWAFTSALFSIVLGQAGLW